MLSPSFPKRLLSSITLLSVCASAYAGPAPQNAAPQEPNYRVRFWNLTNGKAEGDKPQATVSRVNGNTFKVDGDLNITNGVGNLNILLNPYTAGGGRVLQVAVANKATRKLPVDQQPMSFTFPTSNAACDVKYFDDGKDSWLIEFDNQDAPKEAVFRCEQVVAYSLTPDDTQIDTADQRIQTLLNGERKSLSKFENVLAIPVKYSDISDGTGKCSISPNMAGKFFYAYVRAAAEDVRAKADKQFLITSMLKQKNASGEEIVTSTPETSEQRYDRCLTNYSNAKFAVDVILTKGENSFLDVEGWPAPGELISDKKMLDKRFPVSCDMQAILFRSMDASRFFKYLISSVAGEPLPGITPKSYHQSTDASNNNAAHSDDYWSALGYGLNPFSGRKTVTVPTEMYDDNCGNPRAQLDYANRFVTDIKNGNSSGKAVTTVAAVGTVVTTGVALGFGTAASEITAQQTAARAAMFGTAAATAAGGMTTSTIVATGATITAGVDTLALFSHSPQHEPEVKKFITLTFTPPPHDMSKKYNPTAGGGHPKVNNAPVPPVATALKAPVPKIKIHTETPPPMDPPKLVQMTAMSKTNAPVMSFGAGTSPVIAVGGGGSGTGSGNSNGNGVGPGNGPGVYSLANAHVPPHPATPIIIVYTPEARAAKVSGMMYFTVVVGVDGKAKSVTWTKSDLVHQDSSGTDVPESNDYGLKAKATETLRGWAYKPAVELGVVKESMMNIAVPFRLPR